MRRRCKFGIHVYKKQDAGIYHECVWCKQVFYVGDNGTLNKTKEAARAAKHAAWLAEQERKAKAAGA